MEWRRSSFCTSLLLPLCHFFSHERLVSCRIYYNCCQNSSLSICSGQCDQILSFTINFLKLSWVCISPWGHHMFQFSYLILDCIYGKSILLFRYMHKLWTWKDGAVLDLLVVDLWHTDADTTQIWVMANFFVGPEDTMANFFVGPEDTYTLNIA